ncbi:MAG: hypothetical protein FK734_00460 [Asgard group archaeon]|nr:hypothetical protein [Asgard group archaeon]
MSEETDPKFQRSSFLELLYRPFVIYARNFFRYFIYSVIPEFIFYGISLLILIDFQIEYNPVYDRTIFEVSLDFVSDYASSLFFILLIVSVVIFIFRMALITNLTCLYTDNKKPNIFMALDRSVRMLKDIFIFSVFMIIFLALIGIFIFVAILLQQSLYVLSWLMIIGAAFLLFMFGSKISLFVPSMARDEHSFGTAIQRSWQISRKKYYWRTVTIFTLFLVLSIILPWVLTSYLKTTFTDFVWIGALTAILRGFMYPLFDISLSLTYVSAEYEAVEQAVFRDEIREQRKKSEQLMNG